MDVWEWCGTPSAAWGFLFFGIGGGAVITYLLSPKIGLPVGFVLAVFGVYLLIRAYRHRDKLLDEAHTKCKSNDHSWFNDKRFESLAYTYETSEGHFITKTCRFCGYIETSI